jgi:hypothetical protein
MLDNFREKINFKRNYKLKSEIALLLNGKDDIQNMFFPNYFTLKNKHIMNPHFDPKHPPQGPK